MRRCWLLLPEAAVLLLSERIVRFLPRHRQSFPGSIDIIQAVIFLFFAAEQFMSKTRQKMVVKETKEELAKKQQEAAVEGGNA